jgi:hypothetical protein
MAQAKSAKLWDRIREVAEELREKMVEILGPSLQPVPVPVPIQPQRPLRRY